MLQHGAATQVTPLGISWFANGIPANNTNGILRSAIPCSSRQTEGHGTGYGKGRTGGGAHDVLKSLKIHSEAVGKYKL